MTTNFVNKDPVLHIHEDAGPVALQSYLDVNYAGDAGGTGYWLTLSPPWGMSPQHGATANIGLQVFIGTNAGIYSHTGTPTYTPDDDYSGTDSFTVGFDDDDDLARSTFNVQVHAGPDVVGLLPVDPLTSPANADEIVYRVTFSEAVTGVDASDFALAGSTATVTGILAHDASTYDITFSGGDLAGLNGVVTPELVDDDTILSVDSATPLEGVGITGPGDGSYTSPVGLELENTPPNITPPDLTDASDTGLSNTDDITDDRTPDVTYTAELDAMVEIDWDDGNGFVALADGTGAQQTASLATGYATPGVKTITLRATDAAGNVTTKTLDITQTSDPVERVPDVTGFYLLSPEQHPTNSDELTFRVQFDEAVSGVDPSDFAMSGSTAMATSAVMAQTNTRDASYDVTFSGGDLADLDGTVQAMLVDNDSIIGRYSQAPLGGVGQDNGSARSHDVVIDNMPPVLSAPDLTPGSDTGPSDHDDITRDLTPTMRYTAEDGAVVQINWGDGPGFDLLEPGTGAAQTVTLATPYVTCGIKTITLRATDAAGNASIETLDIRVRIPGMACDDDFMAGGNRIDVLSGGPGSDFLLGRGGADILRGGAGDDFAKGGTGDDELRGGAGEDTLRGGAGEDALFGGLDSDILFGGAGNDALDGGRGHDVLRGGLGNDVLTGGRGADLLRGGGGSDHFLFASGDGHDRIVDFEPGSDVIVLEGLAGSFAELQITRAGRDTLIEVDGVTVTLAGIRPGALEASDFDFI